MDLPGFRHGAGLARSGGVRRGVWWAAALGLVIFTILAGMQGFGTVVSTLRQAGWRLLLLGPLFAGPLVITTWGWGWMIPEKARPPWSRLVFARWVGYAMNQLLPVARIGGDVARARMAATGEGLAPVAASVVADKTAQVASVVVLAASALLLLMGRKLDVDLVGPGLVGAALLAAGGTAFYVAQRRGLVGWTGALSSQLLPESMRDRWREGAEEAQTVLRQVYQGIAVPIAVLTHVLFRLGLALELWLLAAWFGHPIDLADAVILEGMNQVLRGAAFMVPGALGAQETGFVVLGEILGIPAPIAFSLSLGKRAREVMVGVPALVAWQWRLGRRAFTQAAEGSER